MHSWYVTGLIAVISPPLGQPARRALIPWYYATCKLNSSMNEQQLSMFIGIPEYPARVQCPLVRSDLCVMSNLNFRVYVLQEC